jgi:hypothetical protein
MNPVRITLIGGPTALIEIDGFRLFSPALRPWSSCRANACGTLAEYPTAAMGQYATVEVYMKPGLRGR